MSIMVFLLVWMMVLMIVFSSSEWTVVKIVLVYVEDNVLHIAGYIENIRCTDQQCTWWCGLSDTENESSWVNANTKEVTVNTF